VRRRVSCWKEKLTHCFEEGKGQTKTLCDSERDYRFSNVLAVITALKQEPEKQEDNRLKQCYNAGRRLTTSLEEVNISLL
jgi:hypothetical protein